MCVRTCVARRMVVRLALWTRVDHQHDTYMCVYVCLLYIIYNMRVYLCCSAAGCTTCTLAARLFCAKRCFGPSLCSGGATLLSRTAKPKAGAWMQCVYTVIVGLMNPEPDAVIPLLLRPRVEGDTRSFGPSICAGKASRLSCITKAALSIAMYAGGSVQY